MKKKPTSQFQCYSVSGFVSHSFSANFCNENGNAGVSDIFPLCLSVQQNENNIGRQVGQRNSCLRLFLQTSFIGCEAAHVPCLNIGPI